MFCAHESGTQKQIVKIKNTAAEIFYKLKQAQGEEALLRS